jgi:hypothetical protein
MTTITPGQTTILIFEAQQYAPNGPPVDVTGLTFALTRTDGTALVAPTAAGITHVATGTYTYPYAAPAGLATGQAFAIWASDQGTASELVSIGAAASSSTGSAACEPWPATYCTTLTGVSPAASGLYLQAATDVLYKLTAQQFGICTFTLRPCRHDCYGNSWPFDGGNWWQWGGLYPRPVLFDGAWFNLTCGSCSGTCSCGPLEEAWLPGPIFAVTEVKVNGIVLSPTAYRVDDFRKLVRTDGGRWPVCQNLTAADTESGTWSVTVQIGQEVPALAQLAVGELYTEIAKACTGVACALPAGVTTITRQGVTLDFDSFVDLLERGLLGLRFCDMLVATYNPDRLRTAPRVYDVDGESYRRVGTA